MMKHQNKNRGFALVELIIGIAVATIVSGMVVAIVQFSSNSFRSTTSEEVTQRQAQAVTSQLNDFVINTKDAVCYYVENIMVSNDQNYEDITSGSTTDLDRVTTKQIRLYEKVDGVVQEQRIEWNKNDQTLLLDEDTSDGKAAVILAKNIADFSVDLKDAFTKQKVYVTIKVVNEDKSYGVDVKTIKLRNNLMINQVPVSDGTGEFIKEITGTKVTASSNTLLPSESILVHGAVQANYSVSQACRYYILQGGNTRVSQIPGYCSINEETGELKAANYIKSNMDIEVIAIPTVVMTSEYSESEQLALSGTIQIFIVSKPITSTQVVGPLSVKAGETQNYSASVVGYPGVSQECRFTMNYNGAPVTSLDNGNITINTNGEVSCGIDLSQDYLVEIVAMPIEIYESELTNAEKNALSGKLNVQLLKKVVIVPELAFVAKKDVMYNGQRSTFTVAETHGFGITNITWSISSGNAYATVNPSTGQVTVKPSAEQGNPFTVKAVANYGTIILSKETTVTVIKPNFTIMNGENELEEVQADFTEGWFGWWYTPETKNYSLEIRLDGVTIANKVSTLSGTLSTYYITGSSPDPSFEGFNGNKKTISVTSPNITFTTKDKDEVSIKNDICYLKLNITITLTDGTTGTINKEIDYNAHIL